MKKSLVAMLALGICVMASQNAMAEPHLGLQSAGFQVGMVNPEDLDATVGFGGFADWGTLTPNIRLASHLDYWSKSEGIPATGKATLRDVAVTMRAKYMFPVSSEKFQPYVGMGMGLHFLNAKVELAGFPDIEDGTSKVGFDFGGGFAAPINPRMDFQADTWYGVVDGFNQLSLKGGLAFKLGS